MVMVLVVAVWCRAGKILGATIYPVRDRFQLAKVLPLVVGWLVVDCLVVGWFVFRL